jgi:elongation factor 1-gamma
MSFTLYTYANNYRAWKILIAAQYNGVDIKVPAFEFGKDNKTESFKAKNPLGKVPVLDTPQGSIFESNAIARYVARLRADTNLLLGNSTFQSGQVDQWIDFATNELEAARNIWLYPIQGYLPYNPKAYAEAKKEVVSALTILNNHLLHNTFLVGNQITLADIVNAVNLVDLWTTVFTADFIKPFGNVTRWFTTLINQPEFSKVIGKVELAKEEKQAGKAAAPAAKKEEKKAEPKKEQPKPAAKPKDDEGDDDDVPREKKAKSELDSLPPSPMVLDVIKKLAFSERPIKKTFFEELWPQFDSKGYVWYTADYKYDDENKVLFQTSNLLSGYIQRSDAVRKYTMAVMNILGNKDEETPPFSIKGAWMFRGQEVPKEVTVENPDSEYYNWTKIDVSTDKGKQIIKDYFMADKINGIDVLDRKYFK